MPIVQTDDIETYYEVSGNGPPIVFIHGALSDHSAAAQQVKAFSDTYTAITYDLRGHGNTTNPSTHRIQSTCWQRTSTRSSPRWALSDQFSVGSRWMV